MDGHLCLRSASLVLMLVSLFSGCLARPWWGYRNEPVDGEEKKGGNLLEELFERMREKVEVERELERLEEGGAEEREVVESREMVEREEKERERERRLLEFGREELQRQRRREVHAQAFLERFGYLATLPKNVSRDPASSRRAIRDMQRMYHLNVTGDLNAETIEKMQMPRCGMPDATPKEYVDLLRTRQKSGQDLPNAAAGSIAQNYYVPGYKWNKEHLTWTLRNYHPALTQDVTKNAFRRAFKFWSDVSGLTFEELAPGSKGDINMQFVWGYHQDGPGNAFDGSGGVLAHAFYPDNGETHFDEQENWTDGKSEGINLMIVAAHELGHALGLGHSNVQGALMAPYYQGYDPNFQLPYDDVQAIQKLYGGPGYRPEQPTPVLETTRAATVRPTTKSQTTKRPTTKGLNPTPPSSSDQPNTCDVIYKAITQTHDYRIYIFNGRWMWRTSEYGLDQGFPLTISTYYENPPEDITATIFSWKTYYTYLFKGRKVWRYYGFQLVDTKTIETHGYPDSPKVAIASKDNTILLIKGGNAWKFDEEALDVNDASNPIPFDNLFPGAPTTFDSAVRLANDQHVYFFKGHNYYKYDEDQRLIVDGYPKEKAGPWMGQACGAEPYTPK